MQNRNCTTEFTGTASRYRPLRARLEDREPRMLGSALLGGRGEEHDLRVSVVQNRNCTTEFTGTASRYRPLRARREEREPRMLVARAQGAVVWSKTLAFL